MVEFSTQEKIVEMMKESKAQAVITFEKAKAETCKMNGEGTFSATAWRHTVIHQEHWDWLEYLNMEVYSENLSMEQGTGAAVILETLRRIIWAIRLPFNDTREPMLVMDAEDTFHKLTGETYYSLRPGKEVSGKVQKVDEYGARLQVSCCCCLCVVVVLFCVNNSKTYQKFTFLLFSNSSTGGTQDRSGTTTLGMWIFTGCRTLTW